MLSKVTVGSLHTVGPGMHGEDPGTGGGWLLGFLVEDARAEPGTFLSGASL
jgi:hypothetical protein